MNTKITILDHLHFDCPTQEQKVALLAMQDFIKEDCSDDFLILSGAAGTGKTSITTALIGYMNAADICYKIAAPTGRAARILGRKSGTVSNTIHSMIYDTESNIETGEVFFKLRDNIEKDYTIFLIDEASMIGSIPQNEEGCLFKSENSLLHSLTLYIKSGNSNNKVIFLGDNNQLAPMHETESKALSKEYLEKEYLWKGATYFLKEVKRQEDGSQILKYATAIRQSMDGGKSHFYASDIPKFNNSASAISAYTKDYESFGSDYCISIACTHKQNRWFNDQVRKRLFGNYPKQVEKGDLLLITQKWSRAEMFLFSGDHVIVEEVDYSKIDKVAGFSFVPIKLKSKSLKGEDVFIEDLILLESIDNPTGVFAIEPEKKLKFERIKKNPQYRESGRPSDDRYVGAIRLTYGHSITCNKSQGGEWDKVYMNEFKIPTLRYHYTAVTRAKSILSRY